MKKKEIVAEYGLGVILLVLATSAGIAASAFYDILKELFPVWAISILFSTSTLFLVGMMGYTLEHLEDYKYENRKVLVPYLKYLSSRFKKSKKE